MKEILYIQAGSLANYIGTHFWNTQETYLSFEEPENSTIRHDVSFKEVLSAPTGQPTYCPRALLFDRKSNFGTLSKNNALGNYSAETVEEDSLWSGDIDQHRQTTISKSEYHVSLEKTSDPGTAQNDDSETHLFQGDQDIRYWSDFSRVFYVPRSIQPVPDPVYGELEIGDWGVSSGLFSRYNEDTSLMDESVRLFLEECDYFQGLHVLNDVDTFGGFTNSFLTVFRDEFSKASSLVLPIISTASFHFADNLGTRARTIINDALYLRSLSEMVTMSVPIQNPMSWPSDRSLRLTGLKQNSIYRGSAVISTHLESSTLSLRLDRFHTTLPDFCSRVRRNGVGPFCQLNGCVPVPISTAFDAQRFNFSTYDSGHNGVEEWSRIDVTRGFSPPLLEKYDQWSFEAKVKGTDVFSTHAFAYPLPTSYPATIHDSDLIVSPYNGKHGPPAVSVLSSISNDNRMAKTFSAYAEYIQKVLRGGVDVGLESDELKELANDLWTLHDSYPGISSYAEDNEID